MNAHTETKPSENIPGVAQRNAGKHSGNQHLPRLPLHDEKIILRPHGGLCLDKWTRPELAGALWSAACLTTKDRQDIIFRLRPQQNLAIISTPQSHVADALYKVRELRLAPDNSCKGIVPGIVPGTSSSTLVDELVAPETQILQARMMGQTNIALVTFEGLKNFVATLIAPANWFVRYATSSATGMTIALHHTWSYARRAAPITPPHCIRALHTANRVMEPTLQTDPNCPRRERQAVSKVWVRKALEKEQRQLQPSIDPTASNKPAETRQSRPPDEEERTITIEEPNLPEKRPPSPSSQQPYKKALQSKAHGKKVHAPFERQRAPEQNTSKAAAPREVGWVEGPPQLTPPSQSLPNSSPHTTTSSTPDPLAEIARLRRDMEGACANACKSRWTRWWQTWAQVHGAPTPTHALQFPPAMKMAPCDAPQLVVWQWNCRGFRQKRSSLQQYVATSTNPPDVILLQEPNCTPSLSGYNTLLGASPLVGALVRNMSRLACMPLVVTSLTKLSK
ncbi:hypothetical protein HPB52_025573 [Rhipicephalus sanguineus]|uniref:Tick transposon n=1 Tax=Rhipicephalus sanguineus TaxID=34632 RepID=A0A9D4YRG4_RHISA|nr:hypothetical protein HPB52_025573 [Rhipicephalus sanguineus]